MTIQPSWIAAACSAFCCLISVILLVVLWRKSGAARESERVIREDLRQSRDEAGRAALELRGEVSGQLKSTTDSLVRTMGELGKMQSERLETVAGGVKSTADTLVRTMGELGKTQNEHLDTVAGRIRELADSNEQRLERVRVTLDERLKLLQDANEKKLDQMRETVDEKLQSTLERRLAESFKLVGDHLEAVQKGLGEMQSLAIGVGDLKRVLTNVKARGTWGEVQLGALLQEMLTPEQFAQNVQTREDGRELVEYAIRLPGRDEEPGSCVWLPIDAKFPQEDYLRLLEAGDLGDAEAMQNAAAALSRSIQSSAKDIHDKYINPPRTTDFAIMFLPTEGLYAEVLRKAGQVEELQRKYRVVVAGPTTLTALLTSLRMGFRTLAIEKRSSEVWKVLGAVKSEFNKFSGVLMKVKKQLETAANTIDQTNSRARAMERKLREVEQLPSDQAGEILALSGLESQDEPEEESKGIGDAESP